MLFKVISHATLNDATGYVVLYSCVPAIDTVFVLAVLGQREAGHAILSWSYHGVTIAAMKVTISLPDRVFSAAEKLAHRLRVSRSQLYVQAIEEYLDKREDSRVTEQLNAVYLAQQAPVDPALAAAQLGAVGHEAW